ncbi:ATP-dependent DNA ligase, putative [Heliorestis convoluta]|uniref:ATP-dependent DNA ligase, putative n=2 Tax=Heliorestis convoluta TaxID=356322 RepID=A0A5Q2N0Y4_9FIRM|nr:ATP-dependent DNA ligase, putative [Heliorestis convoluta]
MPHLQKRPIVMVRHPDGVEGKSFYQKESPSFRPSWLPVLLSTPVRVRSPLPIVS